MNHTQYYKLLVVDDEWIIRDGLTSFHWERYGFLAAGSAGTGLEALEILRKEPMDLVLTDIKMPEMDGLQLCQHIQEYYPSTKVVILTGYKEFEYAKAAITSGVAGYLLKPVDVDELESLLKLLKEQLDAASESARLSVLWHEQEQNLLNSILAGDPATSVALVAELWIPEEETMQHSDFYKSAMKRMTLLLEYYLDKNQLSMEQVLGLPDNWKFNTSNLSFHEIVARLAILAEAVATYVSNQKFNPSLIQGSPLIDEAVRYIENHFSQKLSLSEVAEHVFVTPSYFSIQFKKHTGHNYVDYLKDLRIGKAKELLRRLDLKVYEVGAMVGYPNPKYFTDAFKEHTGFSPLGFRQIRSDE